MKRFPAYAVPRPRIVSVILGLVLAASAAQAAPDPTYAALRAARPDGRRVPVQGLVLERDVFRFHLDSGAFHLLAPVGGRTFGAVFVGQGSYRFSPASDAERRQLALSAGAGEGFETLSDTFDELVLLFTDDTAAEIESHAPVEAGAPDARAVKAYESHLERQRKRFQTNFHIRLLQDFLNPPYPAGRVFMALVDGRELPPALAAVDPQGAEALRVSYGLGGEDSLFFVADDHRGGIWYHSERREDLIRGSRTPAARWTDAFHYTVETRVERDADLAGTTTVQLEPTMAGVRVVPVYLQPELRISEASFALEPPGGTAPEWRPLAFIQEHEKEDADAAVVFPEPLAAGAAVRLRLSYAGDKVLVDAGEKNYVVQARESWYANLGLFSDPATFELRFRVPAGNEIVAVGERTETRTEGKQSVSVWKVDDPVPVAGFNYGRFKKLERRDEVSGLQVAVYTNPGTPDVLREINSVLGSVQVPEELDVEGVPVSFDPSQLPSATRGRLDTEKLAESALVDALNSARLFTTYFGPLPRPQITITQQSQWSFGQSWPTLIFLPYISFLNGTQRNELGMGAGTTSFVEQVGFHEFAHQWWGNYVSAESYRDQWLEEGLAEFSAALAVQHTQGWKAYERFWSNARKVILDKPPGNFVAHWQAGPIIQGRRLSTQKSPTAYDALVYSKGGYVLHMLRMLMWDGSSPTPDAAFIAMMKDFVATHAGRQASTADFQKTVERHMVPALNATGDGKMDWFFRQWVYGTDIPRYEHDLRIEKAGEEYRLTGKLRQTGVSQGFRALVPIYVEMGRGETARVGQVPMLGETEVAVDVRLKLPKKPRRALINGLGEVLARD